jgi:hypothetical protein
VVVAPVTSTACRASPSRDRSEWRFRSEVATVSGRAIVAAAAASSPGSNLQKPSEKTFGRDSAREPASWLTSDRHMTLACSKDDLITIRRQCLPGSASATSAECSERRRCTSNAAAASSSSLRSATQTTLLSPLMTDPAECSGWLLQPYPRRGPRASLGYPRCSAIGTITSATTRPAESTFSYTENTRADFGKRRGRRPVGTGRPRR